MKKFITIATLMVFAAGIANAAPSRFHKRIVASASKGAPLAAVAAGPADEKAKTCDKCRTAEKQAKR